MHLKFVQFYKQSRITLSKYKSKLINYSDHKFNLHPDLAPHVQRVLSPLLQVLHEVLRLLPRLTALPLDDLRQRFLHVPRHVLRVAAHVHVTVVVYDVIHRLGVVLEQVLHVHLLIGVPAECHVQLG